MQNGVLASMAGRLLAALVPALSVVIAAMCIIALHSIHGAPITLVEVSEEMRRCGMLFSELSPCELVGLPCLLRINSIFC